MMLKNILTNCIVWGIMILSFTSCDTNKVYENYVDFEDATWAFSDTVTIPFAIADASKRYNIYTNIRNSIDYGYSNIYIKYALVNKNGDTVSSDLTESVLMDLKTGEPFGERSLVQGQGVGSLYTNQVLLKEGFSFLDSGEFKIKMIQYMREDDLQGIHAVGIRIEKYRGNQ